MKKKKNDLIDREPWYKNHPSPMAKWLSNLSVLGFVWFNQTFGIIWYILFNPAAVILYLSIAVVFAIISIGPK